MDEIGCYRKDKFFNLAIFVLKSRTLCRYLSQRNACVLAIHAECVYMMYSWIRMGSNAMVDHAKKIADANSETIVVLGINSMVHILITCLGC